MGMKKMTLKSLLPFIFEDNKAARISPIGIWVIREKKTSLKLFFTDNQKTRSFINLFQFSQPINLPLV